MAVTFDAVGPSSAGAGNLAAASLSWSHTCAPGAVLLVAAALGAHTSDAGTTLTCSYGGTSMSSVAGPIHSNAGTQGFLQVFGWLSPHAGANTVTVTAAGGNAPTSLAGGSVSLLGAGAFNAPTTATGSGTTASVTDAANTLGNMIVAFTAAGSGLSSATSPLTSAFIINEDPNSGAGNCAGGYVAAPGSSQATAWTISAFDFWAAINIEVQVAPPLNNPIYPSQQLGRLQVRLRKSRQVPQFAVQSPDVTVFPLTVTATTSIPVPGGLSPPFLTSVAGTGEALYFADQNSSPYLLRWDTVWDLIVNAGNSGGVTTYQTDMAGYCAARAGEGFNGFLTTPVANTNIPGAPFNNGNTWDGVAPFTSPGVLNNTFWLRVDYLLNQAASYGMTVVLNAMFTYSLFASGSPLFGWTNTQYQNYGAAVGGRYATQANLVWEVGDDYGGSWDGGLNGFDTQFAAFLTGLRGAGANQMVSVENMSEGSSRYSIDGATTYAWGVAHASWDWVYSYDTAYTAVENAYTEAAAQSVASLCVCKMDGVYDHQLNGATLSESVELYWRKWIWWTLSAGSRGAMYGQNELYQWPVNALSSGLAGSSPGSQYMQPAALKTALDTFASFTDWNLLVPDTSSALVTAGRGTRSNGAFGTGAGTAGPTSMYLGGNTYVTASITPAGSLAVIYIPAHTTITVNGSLMVSGYTAHWVDPANGTATTATIASTYNSATPGTNSAGDADWLLVLQAAGTATGTASIAGAGSVTAVVTQAAVAPAAGTGSVAAVATVIAAAAAAGAGAVTAVATVIAPAAAAGAGSVTDVATQAVTAAAAGAGSVTAVVTEVAAASAAGAGAVSDVVTQIAPAAAAGAGSVTASGASSGAATATAAGAGAVTAAVTQIAPAAGAGAGTVTTAVTQAAGATAAGAGSVTALATQIAPAAAAGTAAAADVVTQIAGASAAGAGSVTAAGSVIGSGNTAAAAGAAAVTAVATQIAPAAGAGAGAVTDVVTQAAKATAAGTGAATAAGQITGTANVAGVGTVTATAAQAAIAGAAGTGVLSALATQAATAALAAAGTATATGVIQLAFTVGTLTAATAPGGTAGGTLTASDTRTGGPGG